MKPWRKLIARIEIGWNGYWINEGWADTRASRYAMDAWGREIPWFTYAALDFLAERVRSNSRVLEFGAGAGTVWWGNRVKYVVAIEHDKAWARRIAKRTCADIRIAAADCASDYIGAADDCTGSDVVIIDGVHRVNCLLHANRWVSEDGVIILDDAQRSEYRVGVDALKGQGFRSISFSGVQPVSKHRGCTAIFYREDNVLGI